jgi:hypothetical protein
MFTSSGRKIMDYEWKYGAKNMDAWEPGEIVRMVRVESREEGTFGMTNEKLLPFNRLIWKQTTKKRG